MCGFHSVDGAADVAEVVVDAERPAPRGPSRVSVEMTSYSVRHGADDDVGALLDRVRRNRGAGARARGRAACRRS